MKSDVLVSIGLPVRNGADRIEAVINSVLSQDHNRLELVICDNASTDGTEELCRRIATEDRRVVYRRHPENIGLLNNFKFAIESATGTYFRWIGDDDWLEPTFVSKALDVFAQNTRLILVSTRIAYQEPDGSVLTDSTYDWAPLGSDDPVERLAEMLRLLNDSYLKVDPLYAMVRRNPVVPIPRRNMLREDRVFAANLALAGPWSHIPEVLAHRHTKDETRASVARLLGAPAWHAHAANTLEFSEILHGVDRADLTAMQRQEARRLVRRMYLHRQRVFYTRRFRSALRNAGFGAGRKATAASAN